jgi:hypothetical protein
MAKKKSETSDASESKPKSAKKTAKKATRPTEGGSFAGVDTNAAAKLAALMIAKKVELPTTGGRSSKPSPTMQQLKQGAGLPANLGGGLNTILGQKKNVGHAQQNQLGRNQVGGHINPNVPRRTPG